MPTLVVTVAAVLMGVAFDATPSRLILLFGAVFTGQLSIGWSNDLIDARRDRLAARVDKPVATGQLNVGVLRVAVVVALALTVVASLMCGLMAGLVHLLVVICGWAYNLGLKSSVVSPLPYAVAFGALPHAAALTSQPGMWAPAWLSITAGLIGVAAHLLNCLPDLEEDAAAGVRGVPHRLGPVGSRWVATVVLLAGVVGAVQGAGLSAQVRVLVAAAVVAAGVVVATGPGRAPFLALAALALVLLILMGHRLAV